jgi:hypothetical protein
VTTERVIELERNIGKKLEIGRGGHDFCKFLQEFIEIS